MNASIQSYIWKVYTANSSGWKYLAYNIKDNNIIFIFFTPLFKARVNIWATFSIA